jgi:aminopeptidase N
MTLEHRHHARCACGSNLSAYGESSAGWRPFALAGTKRVYERARPFAIRHIALDLTLEVADKAIRGTAEIEVGRIDHQATELQLDAVGFELGSVELLRAAPAAAGKKKNGHGGWQRADHVYDGSILRVSIPRTMRSAKVRVTYRAIPRRGLYFLAPDEHVKDRPRQVWSQCQDEDARHVFPCHDKPHVKQTTEMRVKAPAGWFVLGNGVLVSEPKERKGGVYHWKMDEPHPSYLVTLVAGEFAELTAEADGIPLSYYVPKGRESDGKRTFKRTPDMVEHFGELTGVRYPWNKYAQVVVSDFIFGGMENTTATTMYEHILLDPRAALDISSDDLIAHELAHQWFGDFVTCRDWSHAWLNEGFATFMEHIDREHNLGRDEYDYGLYNDMDAYLQEARGRYRRPIVCQDYEAPIDIFDRHLYEKGSLVLHMLRRELGDASFWQGVNRYLTEHAKQVVETRDLMRALEEVSGKSLERFFEQWVYRAGHPELEIKIEHEPGVLTVSVKQAQHVAHGHHHEPHASHSETTVPVFALDLVFDIALADGIRREVRRVDQRHQTFAIPTRERPRFVVVDPEFSVLGDMRVSAPGDMLRTQLSKAPTARGRMLATPGLAKLDDPPTTNALGATLADAKEFWGVRAEAAEALGRLRSSAAFALLAENARTKHPKVRRAIAHALGKFRTAKSAEVLKPLALRDDSYLVEAEAARALGATRQTSAFDTLIEILDRPSWGDVIRQGALDGLAAMRDDRAIPHVTARTRYGVNTRGRRAAIMALPKLSSDRRTRETLEELLDSPDPYLRVDVVRALGDLGDAKSRGPLQRQLERDLDGRVRRRIRELLRDLGTAGKKEADKLRDELESLRGEHRELRARIGKLESLVTPDTDIATSKPRVKPASVRPTVRPASSGKNGKSKNGARATR